MNETAAGCRPKVEVGVGRGGNQMALLYLDTKSTLTYSALRSADNYPVTLLKVTNEFERSNSVPWNSEHKFLYNI